MGSLSSLNSVDGGERGGNNKANFREIETEIIDGGGKGDVMYKDKFHSILSTWH